ncbi:MAG: two-component regulator propeller domain-containing protein [Acidobacteriota bacterium]
MRGEARPGCGGATVHGDARRRVGARAGLWTLGLTVFAVILGTVSAVEAQRLEVRSFGLDDGLASGEIHDLVQDEIGRLWLATGNGVAVYDGRSLTNFGVADGLAWSDQALVGWRAGRLYSAARQAPYPVFLFDGETFSPLPLPSLPLDVAGGPASLVVGVPGIEAALATNRGVLTTDGSAWRLLGPEDGLPSPRVRSLAAWRGRLAVATDRGLSLLSGDTVDVGFERRLAGAPSADLVALLADDDTLWIVGRDWLGRLRDSELKVLGAGLDLGIDAGPGVGPDADPKPERVVAAPDGQGGLYIASGGALRHFDRRRGRLTVLDARRGVDVGFVTCVLLDREGAVWVGGDRGLVQILDRRFASYTTQDGLYDSAVVSLHQRPAGDLVLGHRGGLSFIDGSAVESLSLALTSPDGRRLEQVRDVTDAADGGLWLAADTRGLGRRSPDGGLRWYGAREGLEGAVTSVFRDGEDVLWVGTEGGVRVRRGERFESLPGAPGLHVRNLADGLDGSLLVATEDGLHRYSAVDGWSEWRCGRPACDSTFGVLPDALGHWVATASGLYRAPLTGARLVPSHLPKVEEPVFFIVRDGARLWLGTEDGVMGITPGGGAVDRLSVEQGLSGRETYRTGALVDGSGRLWVGTERGLSRYDSHFERAAPPPPKVHLTAALVDGVAHPLDTRIDLPSDVREATFRFRAVTLSGQHRLRFRSWLEGVDESWLPPYVSESQEIRIAGLVPGTYRFHLQAALGDARKDCG